MTFLPRPLRPSALLPLLALSCLLLASVACGVPTAFHARPYPPGRELHLLVSIGDQFTHLSQANVLVTVRFATLEDVAPADAASITCNGHDITPRAPSPFAHQSSNLPCPRQPPGGAYHLVYTDEHGATTSAILPIPSGEFALRSPTNGGILPIVRDQPILIRVGVPVSVSGGTVSATLSHWESCASGLGCTIRSGEVCVPQSQGECTVQLDDVPEPSGTSYLSASLDVTTALQESAFADATAHFNDTANAVFTTKIMDPA
jgi:hypothetical protein